MAKPTKLIRQTPHIYHGKHIKNYYGKNTDKYIMASYRKIERDIDLIKYKSIVYDLFPNVQP